MRSVMAAVMVLLGMCLAAVSASGVCVGDCNGDGALVIAEAPSCARIRAGERDLSTCPNCDGDGDLMVDECEVAEASRNFLQACRDYVPCEPTATPTETPPGGSPTATLTPTVPPASTATVARTPVDCAGDCDGNGRVTVDELILGSSIALATNDTADCPAFDVDADDYVSIDELVLGVAFALEGCPG